MPEYQRADGEIVLILERVIADFQQMVWDWANVRAKGQPGKKRKSEVLQPSLV